MNLFCIIVLASIPFLIVAVFAYALVRSGAKSLPTHPD